LSVPCREIIQREKCARWVNSSPILQKAVAAGDHIRTEWALPRLLQAYQSLLIAGTQSSLPSRTLVLGDHNDLAPGMM
jgi:hypothetical protein